MEIVKRLITVVFLCLGMFVSAQQKVEILENNTQYSFKPFYHIANEGETSFEKIKNADFTIQHIEKREIGRAYWRKFFIDVHSKKHPDFMQIITSKADKITLYIPLKNGTYKTQITGFSISKVINEIEELQTLYVKTDEVDFSKPFYTKNVPMSVFGLQSIHSNLDNYYIVTHADRPIVLDKYYKDRKHKENNFNYIYTLLIGMIIISFIYFFLHFLITQKIYFLFYSLYLFFLIFNYGYRTFYFYNFYSDIHPYLYFYINDIGQLLSNLSYILFVNTFINLKDNYPKLYPFYKTMLWYFILFIVLYTIVIIINPFFEYRDLVIRTNIYIISFVSMLLVSYMMFTKYLLHTTIVFIGSVIITIGYITATILDDFFVLVPIIVLDTVIFMSLITYLDLLHFKRSLEREKIASINEIKTNFFTNISHEFRTPLTLISGPIQSELQREDLTPKQRDNFRIIKRNADRLLNLVDQLLSISKTESKDIRLHITKQNVISFVGSIIEGFQYLAIQKGIEFNTQLNAAKQDTWFDKEVIDKIINNLLSNAIKYTPENGTINCSASVKNGLFYFDIENTGKGLTKDQQEKIFERFYQLDVNSDGVGIGLSLIKDLTYLHKGNISVKSEINKTTTFSLQIPIEKSVFPKDSILEVYAEQIVPHLHESIVRSDSLEEVLDDTMLHSDKPILLIVDDNKDILTYVGSIFSSQYAIIKAVNGKEGVDLAIKHIPDIIISDVMMPEMSGTELCQTLKTDQRTSHIPIILLTAKAGEDNELTGFETGADAYIIKPFKEELLKVRVEKLIESRKKLQLYYSKNNSLKKGKTIKAPLAEQQFLERLQDVLDQHLTENSFNAVMFSDILGMSRMQLHRKLKAIIGVSTSEFIKIERLKLALEKLKKPTSNISDIAYDIGFNDHAYFSKCFKEKYHCTPTEYQKRCN